MKVNLSITDNNGGVTTYGVYVKTENMSGKTEAEMLKKCVSHTLDKHFEHITMYNK